SFVRHRFAEGRALDELVQPPATDTVPVLDHLEPRPETDASAPTPYDPEPVGEWRQAWIRTAFTVAVDRTSSAAPVDVPAVIAGELVHTDRTIDSLDPGETTRLVARSASCTSSDADAAVAAALAVAEKWGATPVTDRAALLFRAAAHLRARRNE